MVLCTRAVLAVVPRQMHMTSSMQNDLPAGVRVHHVTALNREEAHWMTEEKPMPEDQKAKRTLHLANVVRAHRDIIP